MGAAFAKVHNESKMWLKKNAKVMLIVLIVYAAMVAGNHVQHGGEPVIGIVAGVASAAAAFAAAFFIAGPIVLVMMTLFTYFIERKPGTR